MTDEVTDEVTDFRWVIRDDVDFSVNPPEGQRRVRAIGRFRGELVYADSWVSEELLNDPEPLELFLRRTITDWAREHWPPVPSWPAEPKE